MAAGVFVNITPDLLPVQKHVFTYRSKEKRKYEKKSLHCSIYSLFYCTTCHPRDSVVFTTLSLSFQIRTAGRATHYTDL